MWKYCAALRLRSDAWILAEDGRYVAPFDLALETAKLHSSICAPKGHGMRILFIRPGAFPPELYAGTELTLHWLCHRLIEHGHEVMVSALRRTGPPMAPAVDCVCGYPVARGNSVMESVRLAAQHMRPDVLAMTESGPWTSRLLPLVGNMPIVVYEHEVAEASVNAPLELRLRAVYVANSRATAAHLKNLCSVSAAIVQPLFGVERYAGIEPHGESVLFVSLQHRKGADIAIKLAESRPAIPFIFVESWTQIPEQTAKMREHVRTLPNVELVPNQPNLDSILPQIKLHLMPSRSQEAWGRTATEAQICGIPVLASNRGNLPATIGAGGITLDPDEPFERWLAAFDRIMGDADVYADLSQKARAQGSRWIEDAKLAYETFENALQEAVARRAA
jgi:glycosyltransferase involved in cell wall biosynthesis